jgi:hypothetical protein
LKLYVYNKINEALPGKIKFKDVELRVFPPAVNVRNLKDFVIKNKNIVSFREINAEIPLTSLLAKVKTVHLYVLEPKIVFDNTLFKKGKPLFSSKTPKFKIDRINIIDGELIYDTPKLYFNLLRFNLKSFPREKNTIYRFTSPHLKIVFPVNREQVKIEGAVQGEFKEQPDSWKISKFYWDTRYVKVNLNGRIYKKGRIVLNAYTHGSARQILDPLVKEFSIRDFMYGNARVKRSEKGLMAINGEFYSNHFTCAGEPFKNLKGTINWDNRSNRIISNSSFYDDRFQTMLRVEVKKKKVNIFARNASAARLTRMIKINETVPIGGLLKEGRFSINRNIVNGTVHLEKDPDMSADFNPAQFNGAGQVDFTYHSKKKSVLFSTPGLKTEFGKITALKGNHTPREKTQLDLYFKGSINESAFLDKYTGFYIGLSLKDWKLRKGNGTVEAHVQKLNGDYFVEGDLLLRDFYTCGEKLDTLKGHIVTERNITRGTFTAVDKGLEGEADLFLDSREKEYRIRFANLNGEAKKLINILELDLELKGRMKGDFVYTSDFAAADPFLQGKFRADKINFYDFDLENFSTDLEYRENSRAITLKNVKARYMSGTGSAEVYINNSTEQFKVDGKILNIDLQRMNNQFTGSGNLFFSGQGAFNRDPITMTYQSGDIYFYPDRSFTMDGKGDILTDFSDYRLEARGFIRSGPSASPFTVRLSQSDSRYSGDFHADITDIDLLIPWGDNKGKINLDGQIITRSDGVLGAEGHADFKGEYLSFPNFPHTLDDFSGDLIFKDLDFNLRSLRGTIGDGPVEARGYLNIKNNRVDQLFLGLTGKRMNVYLIDRSGFTMDADLTLRLVDEKLLLSGELNALAGIWEREVDEEVSFYTNPDLSESGTTLLDMLVYDLKLVGKENMVVRNSLVELRGSFNLHLTGNVDFPLLTGVIESRDGYLFFSGKKFDLVKGKVIFNNKFTLDPLVNIEAEAFIKNYRIRFNVTGLASKLKPGLQSSPPLPPRDILTLIAVGELFRRPTSTELSSQIGTGTTDLIASELTEQIKKRTKKIFGDYLLRIDPNISGLTGASLEDTSRLIVGKEIAKDFLVVYSTNFSTQRQQVVYVHYQLTHSISLIGMRNEEGRLSIELRFRKRR